MPIIDVDETAHLATLGSIRHHLTVKWTRAILSKMRRMPLTRQASGIWTRLRGKYPIFPCRERTWSELSWSHRHWSGLCRCTESLNQEHLCAMWFFAA